MNTSTLHQYVQQHNARGKRLGQQPMSLLNQQHRQKIAHSIDADLGPERWCCDGELRGSAVRHQRETLIRCADELISIDCTVTFYGFN